MFQVNKKLWSFNFGCLIASSFLWLVSWANAAPIPEVLYPHTEFVLYYYESSVAAAGAFLLTMFTIIIMGKGFNICSSEHPFWLALPSLFLLALTTLTAFSLLSAMLYVAVPALSVMVIAAFTCRLMKQKKRLFA